MRISERQYFLIWWLITKIELKCSAFSSNVSTLDLLYLGFVLPRTTNDDQINIKSNYV
jgi:hypothetical protein